MSSLSIRLFGYPQILVDDKPIKVDRRKTLALIAYLAVKSELVGLDLQPSTDKPPQSYGREALAALLWPDSSPEQAQAGLRQALWDFSKAAGEGWVDRDSQAIVLRFSAGIRVDVNEFEEMISCLKLGRQARQPESSLLEERLSLYQADFLAGFSLRDSPAFDDWQSYQTEKLRLHLGQLMEVFVRECEIQGKIDSALSYSRRWLEVDPYNETAVRSLMHLYEVNGQRFAALHHYENFRDHLDDELGIMPAPETALLYRRIRDGQSGVAIPTGSAALRRQRISPSRDTPRRPTGTVTFIFTDIEGSTRLWENHPKLMPSAFKRQEALVRQSMAAHGGTIYKMVGDAFQIAFATAPDALAAAVETQQALQSASWESEIGPLKVRMAIHTGVTEEREDDYLGPDLNRAGRILNACHGEQVLLSQATYELVRDHLPEGILLRDLGEHQLKDLAHPEHLYQVVAPGLKSEFPPIKTDFRHPNLPPQSTPFMGRENELSQINTLLNHPDCRLISLVGIGGCGKTRLAIQAAAQTQALVGNVFFVALASITTREDLILAIAEAVGCSLSSPLGSNLSLVQAQEHLFRYLSGRKALLVMDNFEQLIGCADVLSGLVLAAPGVKLVVTSRERLNLPYEWVLELVGLPFPPNHEIDQIQQFASVQLFVKTAERLTHFSVAESDWLAIARVCQLLEGLPLGIEMAAAWTKILSCSEIVSEIEQDLDFLTSAWRGLPERHRTIRAVFDYSWNLLSRKEQDTFVRLAIFQDGFTRQAAFEVAGASLSLLSALADKSFLRRVSSGRFEIHPVLKQYADEKLSESAGFLQLKREFGHFYSDWLPGYFGKLMGNDQLTALSELRAEKHNLRLASTILLEQREFERIEQIFPTLFLFYFMNDQRVEAQAFAHLLKSLVTLLREPADSDKQKAYPALLALILTALFEFEYTLQDISQDGVKQQEANNIQKESLRLAQELPDSQIKAIIYMLNSRELRVDTAEELELCRQSIAIFQRIHDAPGVALAKLILADAAIFGHNNLALAREAYQDSLEIFEMLENDWGQSLCFNGLSLLALKEERLEDAYFLGCQAVEHLDRLQNFERQLLIRDQLASIALTLGKLEEARHHYEVNMAHYAHQGDDRRWGYYQSLIQSLDPGISTRSN